MKKEKQNSEVYDLRRHAEDELRNTFEPGDDDDLAKMSGENIASLIHELRVHQIELQLQNEELRRIQEELEKTRDRYSHLYDSAPIGYMTVSEKGILKEVNLTLATMLGEVRGLLIGKFFNHFVLSEIIATVSDITNQKEMESRLQQAQKLESIGTLAGGLAHEFNNILCIIIGNNELIMDNLPESSHAREYSQAIQTAGLRAADVVKHLMMFGRKVDAGKTPIHIGSVVKDAMKLIRSSISANITIDQNIAEDVSPIIGNSTQINQILINLCGNAADAMINTGGAISVNLNNETLDEKFVKLNPSLSPGQHVRLTVKDTGHGMDKKTLGRIFDPYFTTKKAGKGTGVGLAIVHGIVENHNGAIFAESVPDKGAEFTVLIPAYAGQIENEVEAEIVLPTGHESVLLVDDEPALFRLGKQRLEGLGYRVNGSTDSPEALSMFKADPGAYDLVITDMAMPRMTGDQLAIEILKIRPDIPILLCTGYSEKLSEEDAYEIGICSFAMKPLNKADFAVYVREAIDKAKGSSYT